MSSDTVVGTFQTLEKLATSPQMCKKKCSYVMVRDDIKKRVGG